MLVLTSSCRRRSSFLYSWPILLHPKPPLFLRLDLHQIVFQPVISQILVLGNKSWFGAGRNGRCAGELRLRETLEKCFGAAQASDGTVVLFSGKHRRRRGLPDAFLSWGGNWGSFFVRRRFFLTLSCWETLSRTDRTERTNRGVRLAVIWAAAINLKNIYITHQRSEEFCLYNIDESTTLVKRHDVFCLSTLKASSDITPYSTAASVPLALFRCVEPLVCRCLRLAPDAFTSELLLRGQSWREKEPPPVDESGSELSASNSWLSCRASKGLAGAGAAGTVVGRDKWETRAFENRYKKADRG